MLSAEDVTRLMNERSPRAKVEVMANVVEAYETVDLSETEQTLIEDIFGLLAHDAEVLVRSSLAQAVKSNPKIPHDLAVTIARDVSVVAVPFVSVSEVLNQEDLVDLVSTHVPDVQMAIADRPDVSESVSHALVEHGNRKVVGVLMKNQAAQIHEDTYMAALDHYGHDRELAHAMALRSVVPLPVAERLVTLVTDRMRISIASKYDLPDSVVSSAVMQTRDQTTLQLLDPDASPDQVMEMVIGLNKRGRLSERLVGQALDRGDLVFFEAAMSVLSGVKLENVQVLVRDQGAMGLLALYRKAGLSDENYQSVRWKVDEAYGIRPDRVSPSFNFSGESLRGADSTFADDDPFADDSSWTDIV